MQQPANGSQGTQQNGANVDTGGEHAANGNTSPRCDGDVNGVNGENNQAPGPPKVMDKTNQDIVRLIGQHLKAVGLE